jgi:hypothetical protein
MAIGSGHPEPVEGSTPLALDVLYLLQNVYSSFPDISLLLITGCIVWCMRKIFTLLLLAALDPSTGSG